MAEQYVNQRMPMSRYQRLEHLRSQLDNERQSFISHWRDLGDYVLPMRARFTLSESNRGQRRSQNIIDSTATFAARTLSSGMMAGMTNPARPWKRLTVPDPALAELDNVKQWLHDVNTRMDTVFIRSNLYNALPTVYGDLGVFGTGAMAVLEDSETVIRCYPFPIGSYMLANDSKLQVRVFFREFRMTVRQIVEKFGDGGKDWSRITNATRALWDAREYEKWVDVVHAIFPNEYYDGESEISSRKPFAECYYEKGNNADEKKLLGESGYSEFPILAPRWEITGEDVYATNCPGMTALGDIKMLQHGEKRGMQALDKLVNPPMVGPSSLRTQKSSILPGDITYVDERNGGGGFKPAHEIRPDLLSLERKQEQVRYRIRRAFFEDLFLMLASNPALDDRANITAREIDERHEEKLLALGPVLEQLNQDLLDPLIDRTFAIMLRKGLIPDPPPELEGASLKVEYISIMAQAQKMVGLAGLERFAQFTANLAATNPDVLDKVDFDQVIDEYGGMTGAPPRVIVSDENVARIREAKAKAQQAAQNAATMAEASKAALNLSKSDTRGDNALTDLMRASQAGALEGAA